MNVVQKMIYVNGARCQRDNHQLVTSDKVSTELIMNSSLLNFFNTQQGWQNINNNLR